MLQRLCDTYCSPLEMKNDTYVAFFIKCTVSILYCLFIHMPYIWDKWSIMYAFPPAIQTYSGPIYLWVLLHIRILAFIICRCALHIGTISSPLTTQLGLQLWLICSQPLWHFVTAPFTPNLTSFLLTLLKLVVLVSSLITLRWVNTFFYDFISFQNQMSNRWKTNWTTFNLM